MKSFIHSGLIFRLRCRTVCFGIPFIIYPIPSYVTILYNQG